MPHCLSPANCLSLTGRLRWHPHSPESQNEKSRSTSISSPRRASSSVHGSQAQLWSKPPSTTIHDLDDDSLLHTFYLLRPGMLHIDERLSISWEWNGQRWWYKLVHVCQRWRRLILESASYLRLCLLCTPGTPVADMLAHSPPLPLILGLYQPYHDLTAEDEEGIMLTLRHRDRVRFIYLNVTVPSLKKLLPSVDDEFSALEYLHIGLPTRHDTHLTLPPTFQAPHLRYLWLRHFTSQIGSPLLSTAIGLVTLSLDWIHPSTYPHPNSFLQLLLFLPHLERIYFTLRTSVPISDIERQMSQAPITIHVTHPNIRLFHFVGDTEFLEAILPHLAAPLLETFLVQFFNERHFSVPHLAKFMMNTPKLRSRGLKFVLHREAVMLVSRATVGATLKNIELGVWCRHLDQQVSFATQISSVLSPLLSDVVDLTLDYRKHTLSSEQHNQVDYTRWRELLSPFTNVATLRIHNGLVGEVSRSLISDGETPLDVLPKLKELICPTRCIDDKTFALFIREREAAGQPVSLVGKKFPVGCSNYVFFSSTGKTYIGPN